MFLTLVDAFVLCILRFFFYDINDDYLRWDVGALISYVVRELQCISNVDDVFDPYMRGSAHMFHHEVRDVRTSAV